MVDIETVDIKAAATSILRPVIGDLRSPSLREKPLRRLLLPGRCRRIFSDPYELDIVVERTPRSPITIPRKHNDSPRLHPSGPIENSVIRDFHQRVASTVIVVLRRPGPIPTSGDCWRRSSTIRQATIAAACGSRITLSLAVGDDVDLTTRSSRGVVIASASEAIHAATREKQGCFVADPPRNDGQELASATAVIPAHAGIQYAAAYPFHRRRLLNTGSSAFADDDN
jgi:hypothetical protein